MRRVDLKQLSHVVAKEGKTVARCPACKAQGKDVTGNNLVIYPDGRFACAAYPRSKKHNLEILNLAGIEIQGAELRYRVSVRRVLHPPSTIIKDFGRFGREDATASASKK